MTEGSASNQQRGKRSGLGKGLGALIPQAPVEQVVTSTRPMDVFFPEARSGEPRPRGGSARDLLNPQRRGTSRRNGGRAEPRFSRQKPGGGGAGNEERTDASELFNSLIGTNVSRETSKPHDQSAPGGSTIGATYAELPTELIIANARQPRNTFDEDELEELVASIREVGVLQPVVVRPISLSDEPTERLRELMEEKPEARFELIMGERRLRSCERAGLTTIPAIIRNTEDTDMLRDALLENLHRAQLNPLEEAAAYQQLMADFGATQEELAKKIARSRPQITNTLRLLKLPPSVQTKVAAQVISAGHARALLSLQTEREMEILADRIVAEGLSVRTTEELVRLGRVKAVAARTNRIQSPPSPLALSIAKALEEAYETRVTITEGRKKGKITIEFAGHEDLERLAELILASRPVQE